MLSDCGIYFDNNEYSLAEKMKWALDNEDKLESFGERAQQRINENYNWDKVTEQYEKLFYDLYNGKHPWHLNHKTM